MKGNATPFLSHRILLTSLGSVLLAWLGLAALTLRAEESSEANAAEKYEGDASEVMFVRRIAPLLREKCLGCHGADPDAIEGSLDLRSGESVSTEGDSGEMSIVAGDPDNSPLYLAATRVHDDWSAMPPKESEALSDDDLANLKRWIVSGAKWPTETRQKEIQTQFADAWSVEDGVIVPTSGGLDDAWTNRRYDPDGLWAYQPVAKPEINTDKNPGKNPIDVLIEKEMPAEVEVADRADRVTLIRRASFDLTGLPPTPQQIADFLSDTSPDRQAFAKVVDHLLESPHYGERMAQHWLDVARYADSSGFANDYERGNAWRYRDYVVRAFNQDKPYDEFIVDQIAGDELVEEDQLSGPEASERIVATGFLRMGPWELTGMEVAKVARQRFLDDVTNSVGETFLGHSLQCCRCHDHKFDPVPTQDYYGIQAVFATTQLTERQAEFLPEENKSGFEEQKYLLKRRAEHERVLQELGQVLLANAQTWFKEKGKSPDDWNQAVEHVSKQQNGRGTFKAARTWMSKKGFRQEEYPPKLVGFTPQQFGMERVARKGLERLRWEMERYKPYALAVYNGKTESKKSVNSPIRMPKNPMGQGELEQTCILTGGDPFSPATPVKPTVLSVLGLPAEVPDSVAGRRLAFARWVADAANPLTTRVIVNRIWQWHFGEAIAGNPNNFGSTGKRPTHPDLLDWLAAEFVEGGWSFKAMHRSIMNSDVYCRGGSHPNRKKLTEADPLGISYAVFKPRRLSAEEIRDSMLAISGELNPQIGGIPCRPLINEEVALQPRQVMGTFAAAWTPNPEPEQRNRRSIYVLKLRGLMDPLLEVFNSPGPDFSCERREASTVTPQVFALLNSENTHARALATAARAIQQSSGDVDAVAACFQWIYGRDPSPAETKDVLEHWRGLKGLLKGMDVSMEQPPLNVLRQAVEENTGEKFSFQEILHSNQDYVADLQPSEVDLPTRALADICLLMLNSNEFVYVY